jgi:hypothetical protein
MKTRCIALVLRFWNHIRTVSLVLPLLSVAVVLLLTGCVSKAKAQADIRAAYIAGQQSAMRGAQNPEFPTVTVMGQVRNPKIPWRPDLTLAQALVMADYYGSSEPAGIYIVRGGIGRQVDPRKLLNGEDVPIQLGDIISIQDRNSPSPR